MMATGAKRKMMKQTQTTINTPITSSLSILMPLSIDEPLWSKASSQSRSQSRSQGSAVVAVAESTRSESVDVVSENASTSSAAVVATVSAVAVAVAAFVVGAALVAIGAPWAAVSPHTRAKTNNTFFIFILYFSFSVFYSLCLFDATFIRKVAQR